MREVFDVSELVRIAVEDERTGVAFYSALAKSARSPQARKMFAELAGQEKVHQKRFEEMLGAMGGRSTPEQYEGEYLAYLRTLTDSRALPDEQAAVRLAAQCKDDAAMIDLASRFERDTLMLMNEMRGLVAEKDGPVVDELAAEEQAHLVALAEARRKIGE